MSWNAATRTATFRFPTLPNGGSLPDGRYRATLAAAGVSNAAGTTIAVDYALDFFFLAGDANRDGRVNLQDFNILAANFGQSQREFHPGRFQLRRDREPRGLQHPRRTVRGSPGPVDLDGGGGSFGRHLSRRSIEAQHDPLADLLS